MSWCDWLCSKSYRCHRWVSQYLTLVRILKKAKVDYYEFLGRTADERRERIWAKLNQDIRQRG